MIVGGIYVSSRRNRYRYSSDISFRRNRLNPPPRPAPPTTPHPPPPPPVVGPLEPGAAAPCSIQLYTYCCFYVRQQNVSTFTTSNIFLISITVAGRNIIMSRHLVVTANQSGAVARGVEGGEGGCPGRDAPIYLYTRIYIYARTVAF